MGDVPSANIQGRYSHIIAHIGSLLLFSSSCVRDCLWSWKQYIRLYSVILQCYMSGSFTSLLMQIIIHMSLCSCCWHAMNSLLAVQPMFSRTGLMFIHIYNVCLNFFNIQKSRPSLYFTECKIIISNRIDTRVGTGRFARVLKLKGIVTI